MHLPRVLVVDDELPQRQMLCRLLSGQRFKPLAAASALEAVSLIRSFRPSLALIDISMPEISGIKLFQLLRAAPETSALPIILMTGLSMPGDAVEAMAKGLGAGPIFIKGNYVLSLVERIRSLLSAGANALPAAYPSRILRRGNLTADPETHKAWYDGRLLQLHGRTQFDLLYTLMRHSEPLGREALRLLLWSGSDSAGIVYVSIQRLRQALSAHPAIQIDMTPAGYLLTLKIPAAVSSVEAPSRNNP